MTANVRHERQASAGEACRRLSARWRGLGGVPCTNAPSPRVPHYDAIYTAEPCDAFSRQRQQAHKRCSLLSPKSRRGSDQSQHVSIVPELRSDVPKEAFFPCLAQGAHAGHDRGNRSSGGNGGYDDQQRNNVAHHHETFFSLASSTRTTDPKAETKPTVKMKTLNPATKFALFLIDVCGAPNGTDMWRP